MAGETCQKNNAPCDPRRRETPKILRPVLAWPGESCAAHCRRHSVLGVAACLRLHPSPLCASYSVFIVQCNWGTRLRLCTVRTATHRFWWEWPPLVNAGWAATETRPDADTELHQSPPAWVSLGLRRGGDPASTRHHPRGGNRAWPDPTSGFSPWSWSRDGGSGAHGRTATGSVAPRLYRHGVVFPFPPALLGLSACPPPDGMVSRR